MKCSSTSAGDGVDADDLLVALGVPVLGRVLDEVVADGDHDVGVLEARQRVVARLQADGAERVRVLVVERALAHERLGDADAGRAGELAQRGRRAGARDAVAGQHDRVDRVADELGGRAAARGARAPGGARRAARAAARRRPARAITSSGSSRWVGAGLLGLGDLERLAHDLGDDLRRRSARAFHFVIGRMNIDDVDVLVRLLVHALEVGLAGEGDERRAVEEGVGDAR